MSPDGTRTGTSGSGFQSPAQSGSESGWLTFGVRVSPGPVRHSSESPVRSVPPIGEAGRPDSDFHPGTGPLTLPQIPAPGFGLEIDQNDETRGQRPVEPDLLIRVIARYVEALHRRYPGGPDELRRGGLDARAKVSRMVKLQKDPAA
jgi:hypothetical protein